MPQLGRIEQWNDDKGYGFVRPLESQAGADAPRAFVHVKAIERAGRRPADGDLVRYDTQRDARGRLNAIHVAFVNAVAMRAQAQARGDARAASRMRRASGRRLALAGRIALAVAALALAGGWLRGVLPADDTARVAPETLEQSNVSTTEVLVEMVEAQRLFDIRSKLLSTARDIDEGSAGLMRINS